MFRCEKCGGTFAHFKTPGQCPLCGVWASVRCQRCRYTAHADQFINNNDACPKCGAKVSIPGGGSSGCFVATVAFENADCFEIGVLRSYRDQVLKQHAWGRAVTQLYYRVGPFVAKLVSQSSLLKGLVRSCLVAIVSRCQRSLARLGHQDAEQDAPADADKPRP